MSNIKYMSSRQIAGMIDNTIQRQISEEKNGNYVLAQNYRLEVQNLRKDLLDRKINEANETHRLQLLDLQKQYMDQMKKLEKVQLDARQSFQQQSKILIEQMSSKHKKQIQICKQIGLPTKLKESAQLLNLRKMEEHMKKQKNYPQAHRVQTTISRLEKEELDIWMTSRNIQIHNSLNQLLIKQNTEMNLLKKNLQTKCQEQAKKKYMSQLHITQKYANNQKDLKAHQQREILSLKGQLRTRGGSQSSPIGSKTLIS